MEYVQKLAWLGADRGASAALIFLSSACRPRMHDVSMKILLSILHVYYM